MRVYVLRYKESESRTPCSLAIIVCLSLVFHAIAILTRDLFSLSPARSLTLSLSVFAKATITGFLYQKTAKK